MFIPSNRSRESDRPLSVVRKSASNELAEIAPATLRYDQLLFEMSRPRRRIPNGIGGRQLRSRDVVVSGRSFGSRPLILPLTGARRMRYPIAECDFMQRSIKDKRFAVCCRVLDVRKSTELSGTIPRGRFHANRDQVS